MSDSPQSPPKDVEPGVQSPDDEAQMNDPQDPHAAGLAYEFEVKEQDRWLPIANGELRPSSTSASDLAYEWDRFRGAFGRLQQLVLSLFSFRQTIGAMILFSVMSHDSPTKAAEASHDSPTRTPEARSASKAHKYDVYDANIRNFAPVARIMKLALPENAKIAKEAKECMQECVSEFISFITSEASEKCHQEKRKTVNGEDILFAMTSLGFENYSEALKIYLTKYREQQSQSNRGDTQQNRPSSQGYGAGTAGGSNAVGSTGFQSGDASGGIAEAGESYMYSQGGHNGAAGEPTTY
ncbi:histone-fold-containing protein [Hypoxylon argillaceum]|nr:histone-fold-containing protein [Hypoxylon argillaceum]